MSTPDQDRLDVISEALVKILRRQDELDTRLKRIETAQGFTAPSPPPAVPRPDFAPPAQPPPLPPQAPPPPVPPSIIEASPAVSSPPFEAKVGLNWINRIGVITTIFGAAFFFKYAVDNDWIGPGARVALGVIAAMASLFFGDRLWKREQKIFAQGLTGLGLALLYLSFYATFGLYHLLPQAAAFLLMVLTTAAAAVFALRYDSQAITVLGLVGGYLTPIALATGEDRPWTLFSYTFLLNLGALVLTRVRRWLAVEYVAFAATVLLYGGWFFSASFSNDLSSDQRTVATVFALAFYAQFAVGRSRIIWCIVQFLGPLAVAAIWTEPMVFLTLGLLFAIGGLVVAEFRRWSVAPPWTLACYWIAYWTWREMHGATHYGMFGLLSAAFVLFFLWIVWWAVLRKRPLRGTDLVVLVANAAAYFGASYVLLNPEYHAYMGLFAAAMSGANLLLAKLVWNPAATEDRDTWPALLAVAVALTFLTLAIPIQFSGFRITIAWALEGAALAWLASRFDSPRISFGASAVLVLALLRLLTVDVLIYTNGKQYRAIANIRFLTFLISAASLWLAAKFFRMRLQAAASYIAGHFVMLLALGMEVAGWAERSFAQNDQWSVTTVALSILMAAYAVLLVTIGVVTRTVLNRIMGLGLDGLVVVKLYLSDVWELGRIFRITAFLGLGVLLLLMSYLYSKFRPTIEKLWKDDSQA